jgi:hypothetical protein
MDKLSIISFLTLKKFMIWILNIAKDTCCFFGSPVKPLSQMKWMRMNHLFLTASHSTCHCPLFLCSWDMGHHSALGTDYLRNEKVHLNRLPELFNTDSCIVWHRLFSTAKKTCTMAAHHEPSSQDCFSEEHKYITICFLMFDPEFKSLIVEDHVVVRYYF